MGNAPIPFVDVISWVFLVVNSGRIIAYLPQIRAAWTCPAGARSVSLLTWSYFALANFTALLYSMYVLRDSRSAVIFAGNLLATLFIVGVLCLKRRRRHDAAVPVREAPFAVRKSPKPV